MNNSLVVNVFYRILPHTFPNSVRKLLNIYSGAFNIHDSFQPKLLVGCSETRDNVPLTSLYV